MLWAYHTSIRTPIGVTPFFLIYEGESILPLEIEIPSLRIALQDYIPKEETCQTKLDKLLLLDER